MYGAAFCTVVGELADDPKMRTVGDKQTKLATFRVKVNKPKRRPEDQYGPTAWIDVKAWAYVADMIAQGVKGDPVHLVGEFETESWEKDGKKNYKLVLTASTIYVVNKSSRATAQAPRQERNTNALYEQAEANGGDDIRF